LCKFKTILPLTGSSGIINDPDLRNPKWGDIEYTYPVFD
jgi:hypothetical protein